jgi:hypothetical protein
MRYLALIYTDEATMPAPGTAGFGEMMAGYGAFGEEATKRGALSGGDALLPSTTATTVRVRGGEVLTTDGPYAETKEQLGGYYLLTCPDLDAAIELAAMIPGASDGAVEVRPVMEFD